MTAWLLVAVFIVTFVLVCAIAYLLSSRRSDRQPAGDSHNAAGHPVDPVRINDDTRQTLRNGAVLAYRLLEWFRVGSPDRKATAPPALTGPTTIWTLAAMVAVLGVGLLVFFGVIAVGLKVFELGFEPVLDAVSGPLFLALLTPRVLPVLALAVLALGLPLSRKFRPQGRFVTGLFAVAVGFVCLWQFPKLMARLPTPEARVQLEAPLLIVGLVVSGFLLVCGVQLMGSCEWVRGRHLNFRGRLPVSKPTFERMTTATAAAMRVPDVSATTRARLDTLAGSRKTFVAVYRTVMIAVGLAGLTGAVLLLRSHTPGNMNGLPGGIILLLSLGALLKGIIPGPSIKPVEPLDKDLRDQIRNKINVQVTTAEPLTLAVTENQLRRAAEMIRQGVSPEDAARAVAAAHDSLSGADQQAIAAAVAHYLRRNP